MNTTYRINDTETVTLCRYCVMSQPLQGLWKRGIDTTPDPCEDCGYEPEAPMLWSETLQMHVSIPRD